MIFHPDLEKKAKQEADDMFDPVLLIGITADGIASLILFAFFVRCREIRGRLQPFCLLTLAHAILILLCNYCDARAVVKALRDFYFFSPLVLLIFFLIYTAVLSEYAHIRMTRPLRISGFVFCVNMILQGLLTIVVYIGGYTG